MRSIKRYLCTDSLRTNASFLKFDVAFLEDGVQSVVLQDITQRYSRDFRCLLCIEQWNGHVSITIAGRNRYPTARVHRIIVLDSAEERRPIMYPIGDCTISPSFVLWREAVYGEYDIIFCRYCGRHNIYSGCTTNVFHEKFLRHIDKCAQNNEVCITIPQLLCLILHERCDSSWDYHVVQRKKVLDWMRKNARYSGAFDMTIKL